MLYTSDGRDVEMSVASTKAFYAQVAAGVLLACAITEAAGIATAARRHELLTALRTLPDAMREVLGRARRDRRRRPAVRAVEALLGGRRQRRQHGRRRGGADQAQRALLQVDRLRRHRGQEAHRPVLRAADPRVRGRSRRLAPPTTWARRSRSSGPTRPRPSWSPTTATCAIPRPPRSRCRRSIRRWRSCCRRWSGTCSATRRRSRSTRRRARCARRGR